MTKKREFEDWLEYDLPPLKTKLGLLAHDCHNVDLGKSINEARGRISSLADQYEKNSKKNIKR